MVRNKLGITALVLQIIEKPVQGKLIRVIDDPAER